MVLIKVLLLIVSTIHQWSATSESHNFEEICESPDFVDKTLFIKEFFNSEEKPLVIAAPDGFGKSSNLDMMKKFFSLDINKTHRENLFRHTEIFKDQDFVSNEFGKHPVLYCSFKQQERVVDYNSMMSAFRSILHRTFTQHAYLSKSRRISRYDKRGLTWYTGVKKHLKSKPCKVIVGLYFLSKLLKKHHEKEVILVIDDYDSLILDSVFTTELDYEMVLGLHNAVLSAVLHNNENINKTILTGTTCTCIRPLAQLHDLQCFGFLVNNRFVPYFGITEREINRLLEKEDFKRMKHRKEEIKKWYDGYMSPNLKMHVYNTRSTLSFLRSGTLKNFWAGTRAINTLKNLLIESVVRDLFNDSVQYKPREIQYIGKIQPDHLRGLKTFHDHELWDKEFGDLFLHLLMEKGYFTFAKDWAADSMKKNISIKIPNEEICEVFKQINTSFLADPVELLDKLKAAVHEISVTEKVDEDELLGKDVHEISVTEKVDEAKVLGKEVHEISVTEKVDEDELLDRLKAAMNEISVTEKVDEAKVLGKEVHEISFIEKLDEPELLGKKVHEISVTEKVDEAELLGKKVHKISVTEKADETELLGKKVHEISVTEKVDEAELLGKKVHEISVTEKADETELLGKKVHEISVTEKVDEAKLLVKEVHKISVTEKVDEDELLGKDVHEISITEKENVDKLLNKLT